MNQRPVSLLRFLLWLALFDCGLVAVIVACAMYAPEYLALSISLGTFLFILSVAKAAFALIYNRQLADFPAVPIPVDAEQRRFQSFSFGSVNMGLSIHVAIDDHYLHLTPLGIWQSLGAEPASIPFSKMEPGRTSRCVRIDNWTLWGPAWCLARVHNAQDTDAVDGHQ